MWLDKLLCKYGLHKFEKEPSHRELIKETGVHCIFWSEGYQKGIKRCLRSACLAELKVYRVGMVGAGGRAGQWRKLDPKTEKFIDGLPVM